MVDASASSQFVSALLLAAARFDEGIDVRHDGKPVPSLPHIEMTVAMLREHGVAVDDSGANRWAVAPGPVAAVDRTIEPDLSNAAPFLALAAVTGGEMTVRDWPRATTQAGDALREILTAWGARWPTPTTGCGSAGGVRSRARPRPPRRRRAHPGRGGARRAGRARRPTCAASATSAATRPTGSRPWPASSAAWAPTSPSTPTACRSARRRSTAGSSAPTPTTGWPTPGSIVGAAVDGVLVEDVATTRKTFPDFAGFWAGLL